MTIDSKAVDFCNCLLSEITWKHEEVIREGRGDKI